MFQNDVCICVPTANRPDVVAETLNYVADYYKDLGVDVIYYDSSDNEETERVVKKVVAEGHDNICYKRVKNINTLDYKLWYIFKTDADLLKYRYIWLMSDANSIRKNALKIVKKYTCENFDLIRFPVKRVKNSAKETYICADVRDWYDNCSWHMADMSNTIMSVSLITGVTDWESLRIKYVGADDINDPEHGFFFTVGFYLERIMSLQSFKGLWLKIDTDWRRVSTLKHRSFWLDSFFDVWMRSYCDTILRLPQYKSTDGFITFKPNLGTATPFTRPINKTKLLQLRMGGFLTPDIVRKYQDRWQYVSNMSYETVLNISNISKDELRKKKVVEYGTSFRTWKQNIENVTEKIVDDLIIIYGAGAYGAKVMDKLIGDGYKNRLLGFAVSDVTENFSQIDDVPVRDIREYLPFNKTAAVIIATLAETATEIAENLKTLGFVKVYPLFE